MAYDPSDQGPTGCFGGWIPTRVAYKATNHRYFWGDTVPLFLLEPPKKTPKKSSSKSKYTETIETIRNASETKSLLQVWASPAAPERRDCHAARQTAPAAGRR